VRLFVSLRPPPDVLDPLARAVAGLRTTRPDQWHVTLAFLGEVPDPQPLEPLLERAAAAGAPLDLRLRGGGFFRGSGVLHARLAGDVDGLRQLARRVEDAAREAGVHLEPRPYRPHLTVARRLRADPGVLSGYEGPSWTATELELVRSRLGAAVEHEVLSRHHLGRRATATGSPGRT
jgi:RNA 2',3'-cyclic 3'-phosphodiesterase